MFSRLYPLDLFRFHKAFLLLRDGQKAAKQAIYALHRQDPQKAKFLLEQCEDIVQKDLLPIVEEEPLLRNGSFTNLLEGEKNGLQSTFVILSSNTLFFTTEYAEAKLFYAWLYGDTTQVPEMTPATPPARLLKEDEFAPLKLEPIEYLGGLCDLTGEIKQATT